MSTRKFNDRYLDEFVNEVNPEDREATEEGVYIGPLSRKDSSPCFRESGKGGKKKGASVIAGGEGYSGKGYYFEPTVLVNVNHTMSVMRDESFGPIIGIMKVKGDDEAVKLMQDTEYGLTASFIATGRCGRKKFLSKSMQERATGIAVIG